MQKLTLKSKIKEVYANPVGHDILKKLLLQLNISESWITNPAIRNMKLDMLKSIAGKRLDAEFFDIFLTLINSEHEVPREDAVPIARTWWKEAVFYQIYPRSFMDADGDGIGDLRGITEKLDYLQELGIDAVWLSPIYDSPNDDNGYDIRDYYKIMNEFGTMEDFDQLLKGLHERGMRLIMDLVVNHTSDEHRWFKEALRDPDSKYRDYYFFRDHKDKNTGEQNETPNNWTSFFGGSAWNTYEEEKTSALHLFSKKQMDLNWENKDTRDEIYAMIRWWLEKGVDGFRLDVINYISKTEGLPKGNESIGKLLGFYGIEHYFYGPSLHKYLREMKKEAFLPYDAFTVGETPGIGMEMAKLLTAEYRRELDMIFSFDHLEMPGKFKFDEYNYDLNYLKQYLIDWNRNYGNHCWMSLFYDNHDNPRMLSKINAAPEFRDLLAKLLCVIQFTVKGTPFVFQGQELGMINADFRTIDELRDIESIRMYEEYCKTMQEDKALHKILAGTRDHARTPMPWNDSANGGFTTGTPWILGGDDYIRHNAKLEKKDRHSVYRFYQEMISFRKDHSVFVYGDICFCEEKRSDVFAFYRSSQKEMYYVECNLSNKKQVRKEKMNGYVLCMTNYTKLKDILRPYEANIWRVR